MDEVFKFLSDKAAVTMVFIIIIVISALIVIFINPMRDKFYSHRADQGITGRNAALLMLK